MRRALAVALVALLAAIALRGRPHVGPSAVARSADESPLAPDRPSDATAAASDDATPRGRPRSLRGTRTDGGLAVDADGRFTPTIDARRLFDYFLSASGERSAEALRARIVAEIERRLSPAAAADATALLDRYLAYRERVRTLADGGGDLDARFATLVALRREMLGAQAADAFFADEEADARRLLEVRRITADDTLPPEERVRRVEAIYDQVEADLPPDVRQAHATSRLADTLRAAESEIRSRGGDDAEVRALRERLAGPEAADRLADLDARRAAWQTRVDAFRGARERIQADASLAPSARAAAVERLLADSFTPPERLRVEALDRIAAESKSGR